MTHTYATSIGALGFALLLAAGCGAAISPALKQAQANYRDAREDPRILAYAAFELHDAGRFLEKAEQTWESTGDLEAVNHFAELVNRKIAIAQTTAQRNIAQADLHRVEQERQAALLQARILKTEQAREEAERAKESAEARAQEAEQAYQQARKSVLEIERARRDEASRVREAELARQEAEKQAQAAVLRSQRLEQQLTELRAILSGFIAAAHTK
jgi:hypothetical protein